MRTAGPPQARGARYGRCNHCRSLRRTPAGAGSTRPRPWPARAAGSPDRASRASTSCVVACAHGRIAQGLDAQGPQGSTSVRTAGSSRAVALRLDAALWPSSDGSRIRCAERRLGDGQVSIHWDAHPVSCAHVSAPDLVRTTSGPPCTTRAHRRAGRMAGCPAFARRPCSASRPLRTVFQDGSIVLSTVPFYRFDLVICHRNEIAAPHKGLTTHRSALEIP